MKLTAKDWLAILGTVFVVAVAGMFHFMNWAHGTFMSLREGDQRLGRIENKVDALGVERGIKGFKEIK